MDAPASSAAPDDEARAREVLSPAERRYLLRLARASAGQALGGRPPFPTRPPSEMLRRDGACFVTVKRRDAAAGQGLRGCLGTLEAREPLWRAVARLAADSVTSDPRFADQRVTREELPRLKIEISVLHPPRGLADPLAFTLGEDGIVVEGLGAQAGRRGVYLPQVASEFNFSKEAFLSSCCQNKAGLPSGAWRDPNTCQVYAFRAEVFGEE